MKSLIHIKNNDNKCFLWYHIRHLNPLKTHQDRKTDRNMVNDLDYKCIEFSVSKKCNCKSGQKNNICLNVFCYKNDLTYPVYVSNNKKVKIA